MMEIGIMGLLDEKFTRNANELKRIYDFYYRKNLNEL